MDYYTLLTLTKEYSEEYFNQWKKKLLNIYFLIIVTRDHFLQMSKNNDVEIFVDFSKHFGTADDTWSICDQEQSKRNMWPTQGLIL